MPTASTGRRAAKPERRERPCAHGAWYSGHVTSPLDPSSFRSHYAPFLRDGRVLLTGHSHQAWPDAARAGLVEAYEVAAAQVDDKWSAVFAAQDELRAHVAARIAGASPRELAFAPSTHELVARWLSALPLAKRPRVVTTTGEFHSAHRQLTRLAEEGVEVVFVDAEPVATLAARIAAAIDERTSGVVFSTVLFATSSVVHGVDEVVARAERAGAKVLLDAYHAFDVAKVAVPANAFLVAGGYKYAQMGEGVCFLRVPPSCALRPVYTGWFAGFDELEAARGPASNGARRRVTYGDDGATRFAGSTFDPTSTFRARAVARFFDEHGMTVDALRATSLAQTSRILAAARELRGAPIATPDPDADRAGFVALSLGAERAAAIVRALRAENVYVDARGALLRLGPAPYVTDDEIDRAMAILGRALTA